MLERLRKVQKLWRLLRLNPFSWKLEIQLRASESLFSACRFQAHGSCFQEEKASWIISSFSQTQIGISEFRAILRENPPKDPNFNFSNVWISEEMSRNHRRFCRFWCCGDPLEGWRNLETIHGDQRRPIPSGTWCRLVVETSHDLPISSMFSVPPPTLRFWCHSYPFFMFCRIFMFFCEAWCATRHQKSQNRVALGFAHLGVAPQSLGCCDDMESGAGLRAPNGFVGRSSYSIWPCSDHLQQILEALFNISSFLSISFSCMVVSCFTSFTSPNQTIKLFDPWNRVHLLILPRAKLQAFSQSIRDGIRHILHSHWWLSCYDFSTLSGVLWSSHHPAELVPCRLQGAWGIQLQALEDLNLKICQQPISARTTIDCQLAKFGYPIFFSSLLVHVTVHKGSEAISEVVAVSLLSVPLSL